MVGDRLLTVDGKRYSEDRTKLTLLETADARGVIAFSGLAEVGAFRTDQWLLETLAEVAAPHYTLGAVIEGLRAQAQSRFRALAGPNGRRVSFYFAGFGYPQGDSADPRIACCIVSNFERLGEPLTRGSRATFEVTGRMEVAPEARNADDPAAVLLGGNHPAVKTIQAADLLSLLEADAPTEALLGKAIDVVRQTARSKAAGGNIGEDLLSAVIPSDVAQPAILSHHPVGAPASMTAANMAHLAGPDDVWLARDLSLGPTDPDVRMVPKVGRNDRCPCGSGLKFKRCHGA
jgi:hypothetical protein